MTEESDKPSQTNPEKLILGTWDWKYTQLIGLGLHPPDGRNTPESEGYTEQRRFLENGQVEVYRDWKIVGTYRYWVGRWEDSRLKDPIFNIRMNGVGRQMQISDDQLIIGSGERCGSRMEYYTRVNEVD